MLEFAIFISVGLFVGVETFKLFSLLFMQSLMSRKERIFLLIVASIGAIIAVASIYKAFKTL